MSLLWGSYKSLGQVQPAWATSPNPEHMCKPNLGIKLGLASNNMQHDFVLNQNRQNKRGMGKGCFKKSYFKVALDEKWIN